MAKKATMSNNSVAVMIANRLSKVKPIKGQMGQVTINTGHRLQSAPKYFLDLGLQSFERLAAPLPFGRFCEFSGLPQSGKTALCLRSAIRAQQGYIYEIVVDEQGNKTKRFLTPEEYNITILYIDNEGSLNENETIYADGVKLDILHEDEKGNQVGSVVVVRAETVDLTFKLIDQTITQLEEAEETSKKKQFLLCVVDTINGTASKEELEQEWGKVDYGRQPKQISEGLRSIMPRVERQNVLLLGVNQIRENLKYQPPMHSNPNAEDPDPLQFSISGGRSIPYWTSLRVLFYKINKKYVITKGAQFESGLLIGFRTLKNRMQPGVRTGRFTILTSQTKGGIRDDFSILETLLHLGCAELDPADKETIIFKFKRNGLMPTTFTNTTKSLEDESDEEETTTGRYKDPRIPGRQAWPKFYEEHKADIQLLWEKAVKYAFTVQGIDDSDTPSSIDADDTDEDVYENQSTGKKRPTIETAEL